MKHIVNIVGLAVLLTSCGKGEAPKATERPALVGKKLDPKDTNAKVTRMFSVQGHWEGPKDDTPAAKRLVMDVAGNSEFTMDIRGMEGGKEAVFESAQGRYDWNSKDIMVGEISGQTGPTLTKMANFEAGFAAVDTMTLRSGSVDVELHKSPNRPD